MLKTGLFRERPYDLTYMWNLVNKIKWPTTQKQRHGYMEQTYSWHRGGHLGDGWKKGKGLSKKKKMCIYIYTHRDKDNSEVTARGRVCEGVGGIGQWAVKWGGKRLCLGRWACNSVCRWCYVELYTWNLYDLVNQCHPNKFNLKM